MTQSIEQQIQQILTRDTSQDWKPVLLRDGRLMLKTKATVFESSNIYFLCRTLSDELGYFFESFSIDVDQLSHRMTVLVYFTSCKKRSE